MLEKLPLENWAKSWEGGLQTSQIELRRLGVFFRRSNMHKGNAKNHSSRSKEKNTPALNLQLPIRVLSSSPRTHHPRFLHHVASHHILPINRGSSCFEQPNNEQRTDCVLGSDWEVSSPESSGRRCQISCDLQPPKNSLLITAYRKCQTYKSDNCP